MVRKNENPFRIPSLEGINALLSNAKTSLERARISKELSLLTQQKTNGILGKRIFTPKSLPQGNQISRPNIKAPRNDPTSRPIHPKKFLFRSRLESA